MVALGALFFSFLCRMLVAPNLPRVPYRTLVETYLDMSISCQFLSLLSAVVQDRWGADSAVSLDLVLFVVNLVLYFVYHVWIFWKIRSHLKEAEPWKEKATAGG